MMLTATRSYMNAYVHRSHGGSDVWLKCGDVWLHGFCCLCMLYLCVRPSVCILWVTYIGLYIGIIWLCLDGSGCLCSMHVIYVRLSLLIYRWHKELSMFIIYMYLYAYTCYIYVSSYLIIDSYRASHMHYVVRLGYICMFSNVHDPLLAYVTNIRQSTGITWLCLVVFVYVFMSVFIL